MKKILSFLLLLSVVVSYAQSVISGKITDTDGQAVPSASVTIEEPGKDAIMAYGISNSKGEYKITVNSSVSELDMKVKAFNQKPYTKRISNKTQSQNISLQPQATEIKEVKLKTKMITKRGDTISYDLKAFESKADRTLADVLKKIPGIEVNSDGSILYQGEAINKFYVNGKDLMEGSYGTVNNALPKDAVQKVEVMENHQPVKILQDKVPSENAGLNVVLKKKVTMTGRGEVGLGADPLLWNLKLTPMFFGQKNQWVVNYKTNNNGESVENEGNMLAFGNRWEGRRRQISQNQWLSVDEAGTPSLPEKRYLMNNVHFFSANVLTNPFKDKEWELKVNASYSNNAIERDSYVSTYYEDSGITNNTVTSNNFYNNAAKGELIFTKNAKKGFFKNVTTWNSFWNTDRADLMIEDKDGTTKNFDEGLKSPTGSFQNSLSTIIPWKEKLFNVQSYISYQKDKQKLISNTSNFNSLDSYFDEDLEDNETVHYDDYKQNLETQTMTVNHSASVGFSKKKWTFTPEVGLDLSFNDMNSQLYGDGNMLGSDFLNDMSWNEIKPYTQLGINYKGESFNLNLNIPANFYGIDYKDNLSSVSKEINKTVLEPSLFANYSFASFFKIWAFGNWNYNFGDFGDLYSGYILTSPRVMSIRNSQLPENRTAYASTRLEYRNPLNNLFFNIRYGYSDNKKNLITKTTIDPETNASSSEIIDYDNSSGSETESAEIGKYFPKFKTNLSVSFSNGDSNSFSMLVDKLDVTNLIETKTNTQSFGLKFNNTFFSWLSVDYNISMNWAKRKNLYYQTNTKTEGWSHNLAAYIYPSENHTIGFFWDDINTSVSGTKYRNSFYDISYQYTWVKKKIDFEIKWLNIANNKLYETITYNASQQTITTESVKIRPSQVMFTVKFNFK